jgi:activating signal cointegrator complex subunit 3
MEPFFLWIENPASQDILHSDNLVISKKNCYETVSMTCVIPLSQPHPPQYNVKIISERWVGLSFQETFAISEFLLPDFEQTHTPLLDLCPLPKTALNCSLYESLYPWSHYNPIQTQVFHTLYHTDYNSLIGAPTGSGKTNIAEIAMFRQFNQDPEAKIIYIAPLKSLAKERYDDWNLRFGARSKMNKPVVELTGDFTPDVDALDKAKIIITTPEKWDGISRHWQHRAYVRRVGLIVIDEIHLLGQDRGPVLEVIVSRMRYISANLDIPIR